MFSMQILLFLFP